jgi:rod shape-determining protein MreC
VAPPNRTARVAVLASSAQRKSDRRPPRGRGPAVRRVVLAVLVLGALALLTISFRSPTAGVLHDAQSYGASALRPFQVAGERVARPFHDAYNYVSSLTAAKSENKKLRGEVRSWQALALENLAAAKENTNLKALLNYEQGPTYPKNYRSVNASVISFPSGPFDQHITISAGSSLGLHVNTPIVSAEGLVGRVTNVGRDTATVALLTDPDSVVAARDLTTKVSGLIRHGQGNTLILDQVAKQLVVNKGDVIVTQGTRDRRYPDLYPYGIPVGQVIAVGSSDIASYLTVQVAPFAQLDSLDSVAALIPDKASNRR